MIRLLGVLFVPEVFTFLIIFIAYIIIRDISIFGKRYRIKYIKTNLIYSGNTLQLDYYYQIQIRGLFKWRAVNEEKFLDKNEAIQRYIQIFRKELPYNDIKINI